MQKPSWWTGFAFFTFAIANVTHRTIVNFVIFFIVYGSRPLMTCSAKFSVVHNSIYRTGKQ
jgi:hypothetical protein